MPKKKKLKPKSNVNLVKCPKCGWETDLFGDTFTCNVCGYRMKVTAAKQKSTMSVGGAKSD